MSFLFPGFLFALTAAAIPVIVHLYNFRKFKRVYFSNVRFLKSVKQSTRASQKIRNRLILAARILAIVFLVLAFARPYIPAEEQASPGRPGVVSIYIDNSYSMETVNREGSLLDEAKRRAREIASAYSLNDKFQILTNDFEGIHQRLYSYEDFVDAVDQVEVSRNSRHIGQILSRQYDIFSREPGARKDSYLISDFQKNILSSDRIPADSTVSVHLVRLQANQLPNVSVDSVWFESPVHRAGQTERLIIRLRNHSGKEARQIPVRVRINGQEKALGSLTVPAGQSRSDTLTFSGLSSGWQRGEISITDYPVTFDDQFFFSFRIQRSLPVLAVNGADPSPYLQAVYRSDAFFSLVNTPAGNVDYSGLGRYPVVILSEVEDIPEGLVQQLTAYVRNGGCLVVFPAVTGDLAGLNRLLQSLGSDIAEGVETTEAKVTAMNFQHPVFRGVFERVPRNLELPSARRWIRYSTRSSSGKTSIMDLPGRRTFFGEYASGKGKVYLSAVGLNEEQSNLVTHSVFVPLMYQVAQLSLRDQQLFYTLGRDQLIEIQKFTLNASQSLRLTGGKFEAIPDVRQTPSGTGIYLADQVRETGNYSLTLGDSLLAVFSFNDNRTESDLSYAGDAELKNQFTRPPAGILESGDGSLKNAVRALKSGTHLWKLCIILALVFLAAEILLIRFYREGRKGGAI